MAFIEKKYVDLAGLQTFTNSLKDKLAANSSSAWSVNYAANAGVATNYKTEAGSASIADALKAKVDSTKFTEEIGNLVPKTATIAGVDLQDDITKSELLTALNVADGAQVNVIEEVHLKGSKETSFVKINPVEKVINIDLSNYALISDISSVFKYKGTVDYVKDLPVEATQGDVYHVRYNGDSGNSGLNAEYVYIDGSGWELLGPVVDFSNYYTKTQTDTAISDAIGTAKTEIETAYKAADSALETKLQGNIDALYKVVADGTDTGVIAGRLDAVETKAEANESAIGTLNGADTVEGSVAKKIKDAISDLDSTSSDGTANGGYVLSVTQTDGKVAVEKASFAGDVTTAGTNAVTGTAVSTYVTAQIGSLDVDNIGEAGSFISAVGETDGKIHATPTAFVTSVKASTTEADKIAPTEHAVRTAVDEVYGAFGRVDDADIQKLFA